MNKKLIILEEYKLGYNKLIELLSKISDKEIDYYLERQDAWSIKEHVIHLIDSETNGFIRLKSIIAQPSSSCYVMNEEDWTKNIRRKKEDLNKYLNLYKSIREIAYDFILEENPSTWNSQYFIWKYKDEIVNTTIQKWLEIYNSHLEFHQDFINKILEEIKSKKNL